MLTPDMLHWIEESLAAHGLTVTSPLPEPRERPWSTVVEVPTGRGPVWFKASRGGTRYEAALTRNLVSRVPSAAPTPLAADPEQGWLLTAHAGQTLRDLGQDLGRWTGALRRMAELQRELVPHADGLVGLGVPDLRPRLLPGHYAAMLEHPRVLAGLQAERLGELRGYQTRFEGLCDELAAGPVPASLNHDDLHDNHVFDDGRFQDWGDASVAHPFGVLLVATRVAAQWPQWSEQARAELWQAYLQPWSDLAGQAALTRQIEVAMQLAKLGKAMSYARALAEAPGPTDFDEGVWGWFSELLDPALY